MVADENSDQATEELQKHKSHRQVIVEINPFQGPPHLWPHSRSRERMLARK
jgi:hypothetical protein